MLNRLEHEESSITSGPELGFASLMSHPIDINYVIYTGTLNAHISEHDRSMCSQSTS